jgi:hypothetical protein
VAKEGDMTEPDAATRQRAIDGLTRALQAFHEAERKNPGGRESVSWRGQLGGFRHALGTIFGDRAASSILEAVRRKTNLGFPHIGPVMDNGDILGMDSEAQPGL